MSDTGTRNWESPLMAFGVKTISNTELLSYTALNVSTLQENMKLAFLSD